MTTCAFNGRLGNNMFQIAAALSLAKKTGEDFAFPHTTYAGHRGTIPVDLSIFEYKFSRKEIPVENIKYEEKEDTYNTLPKLKNLTLCGFYQSYRYFDDIRDELINKYFVPNDSIKKRLAEFKISPNAVGVSVRRGDYLMLQQNHCVLGDDYYTSALDNYCQDGDQLFVFSDDFVWCKEKFGDSAIYVSEDIGVQLFLMTKMKHLILSNSTFAWWGAYLNTQGGNIVIPDPWYGPNYDGRGSGLRYPNWKILKHERKVYPFQMTANMYN